jgi:pimeloyl-ACP methyl ester carboxylesterase
MRKTNKQIQIDGAPMSVLDVGTGPVLLFGHGWLCDAAMWHSQVDTLADRYRVIVPEMWGHGQSGAMPAGTRTMADLAHQHLALLDALEVEKATLIGLSLGGMWAGELAILAPDRVSALVLLAVSLAAEPIESREAFLAGIDDMAMQRAISPDLAENLVSLLYGVEFRARAPETVALHKTRLLAWTSDRVADSVAPIGQLIFNRRDALADLAALKMPVHTLAGECDQALPSRRVAAMAEVIGSSFSEILEVGHMLTLEASGSVNAELEDFLKRLPV